MTGFIYVLESDDIPFFKIGFTRNLDRRIQDLQTGSPHDLDLRFSTRARRLDERLCHALLAPYRKKNEWYVACQTVTAFLNDMEAVEPDDLTKWLQSYEIEALDTPQQIEAVMDWPGAYWWEVASSNLAAPTNT